ncbi:MAG: hypothetical protein ACP5P3_07690 [Ignavibacteria bacterium]
MKKQVFQTLVLLFSFVFLLSSCGKKEQTKNSTTPETGITASGAYHIVYDVQSKSSPGTLEMFVKGKNFRMNMEVKEKDMPGKSTIFMQDNIVYMLMEMGGQKMGFKMDIKEFQKEQKDLANITEIKDKLKEWTKEGSEDVIGFKCDIYKDKDGNKYWVYKDYALLKSESKGETIIATKFEPEFKGGDDIFSPPKDVEFKSMDEMMKDMEKELDKPKQNK